MSHTIRVDRDVAEELYRRRRPHERNHSAVIRRALTEESPMHLMLCIDGAEFATVPLIDGNDPFNREAERGALDRAYEAKESNPDSVVTIVIDLTDDEPGEPADATSRTGGRTMTNRVWVNEERTVLVSMWPDGTVTVATREHPSHTWGPPVTLKEEAWPR